MAGEAEKIEELDVKEDSTFMKWLKRIAYIVTIITTLSGGVLGILSYVREVKDPRAQAGYDNHSKMLEENSKNIRENREEIKFIYRTLVAKRSVEPKVEERAKKLPETPIQRPLDWGKLLQQKKAE